MRQFLTAVLAATLLAAGTVIPAVVAANPAPTAGPGMNITVPRAPSAAVTALSDQILIRYRKGTRATERMQIARAHGLTSLHVSPNGRTELAIATGRSATMVRRSLATEPAVEAVSPNFVRRTTADPSGEPGFQFEWGLQNTGQTLTIGGTDFPGTSGIDIQGSPAIGLTPGDPSITVAVIDDGVDFSHPDLAGHQAAGGKDFCHNDADPSPVGTDFHGTHVAGTIAASLDGHGVVGVAPAVKILALKALEHGVSCNGEMAIIDALDYVGTLNMPTTVVPIINASWGGPGFSQPLDDAIRDSGALLVAAAGNDGVDMDADPANRFYPAASAQPNVLSVAAIDQNGQLADFSNFGRTLVDIAAPGVNILSTIPPQPAQGGQPACPSPCYAYLDGTSMAAPHVSGIAALALSRKLPATYSPVELRAHILASGRPLADTAGLTATGRLANAFRASDVVPPVAVAPDRFSLRPGSRLGTSTALLVTRWVAATDDLTGIGRYVLRRVGPDGVKTLGTTISPVSRAVASTVVFGRTYRFMVFAVDLAGNVSADAETSVRAALYQEGISAAKYGRGWTTARSSGASGGTVRTSSRAGASVTFTFTGRGASVVGPTGPTRGSFRIYLDGVYSGIFSERSRTNLSKVVVASALWPTSGTHKLTFVGAGSAGHPRVDVDAFAVIR